MYNSVTLNPKVPFRNSSNTLQLCDIHVALAREEFTPPLKERRQCSGLQIQWHQQIPNGKRKYWWHSILKRGEWAPSLSLRSRRTKLLYTRFRRTSQIKSAKAWKGNKKPRRTVVVRHKLSCSDHRFCSSLLITSYDQLIKYYKSNWMAWIPHFRVCLPKAIWWMFLHDKCCYDQ